MEKATELRQLENLPQDNNPDGGIVDTTLRLGLPNNDDHDHDHDRQQLQPEVPHTTINQDFSNMNVRGYYPDQAWENSGMVNREGNNIEHGTMGYAAKHHFWSPEIGMSQSNNWNEAAAYLGVPSSSIAVNSHGLDNSNNALFPHQDFMHQPNNVPADYDNKQWRNPIVRTCAQCNATETPLWRKGPAGPQILCNGCGLRYSRSLKKDSRNNGH